MFALVLIVMAACFVAMFVDLYRITSEWVDLPQLPKLPRRTERGAVDLSGIRLSFLERAILADNYYSGRPWSRADILCRSRRDALTSWNAVRAALELAPKTSAIDFLTVGDWPGRKVGNVKLSKGSAITAGVTYLPADGAARWAIERPADLEHFSAAMALDPDALREMLRRMTLCPRSTAGCRDGCVIKTAGRAGIELAAARKSGADIWRAHITRGRLSRTLLLALDPGAALRLMVDGIDALAEKGREHGRPRRWRLAVADDVRWELVAPGIMTSCRAGAVRPYAYTKFRPQDRPQPRGAAFTYSASERWTVSDILAAVDAGHRVAVVLDTPRGHELPRTWMGRPVVDGDAVDDQHAHPAGTIVALRAKGNASGRFVFPTSDDGLRDRIARDGYNPRMSAAAPVMVRRR